MTQAKFHEYRGEKSALILVRKPFTFQADPCYIPKEDIPEGIEKGDTFDIPDGYNLVDMVDPDTGKIRTTKDGKNNLKMLAY